MAFINKIVSASGVDMATAVTAINVAIAAIVTLPVPTAPSLGAQPPTINQLTCANLAGNFAVVAGISYYG